MSNTKSILSSLQTGTQAVGDEREASAVVGPSKAPGYYSIHCGKLYLSRGRTVDWPLFSPLVPAKDDSELKERLDYMVSRGQATLVKE